MLYQGFGTRLRQGQSSGWQDDPCSCAQCIGERRNEGGDGTVGFQCFPRSSGLADCRQTEELADRAVQSAELVSYDRYCIYTCKPLLTNEIKQSVDCAHLSHAEVAQEAQSPSSNGQEIVYEAHPLTKVGPISKLVPTEAEQGATVLASMGAGADPVSAIRGAIASLRKAEADAGGLSPYTLPKAAQAPPLCVCHCGNRVNRFRQSESDGVVYPKPHKVKLPSVTATASAEPLRPAMPPPPPAELPAPWMPQGLEPALQELPVLPQAPLEVMGPLPLAELGKSDLFPAREGPEGPSPGVQLRVLRSQPDKPAVLKRGLGGVAGSWLALK
ncbi:unnamed protein product [Effrenium voratum]|nr:unnamed protein product [Effrenium voratum]